MRVVAAKGWVVVMAVVLGLCNIYVQHIQFTCTASTQGIAEFKREIRGMFKKSEAKRQLLMSVAGNRVDTEEVSE